jgi:cytochrome c1
MLVVSGRAMLVVPGVLVVAMVMTGCGRTREPQQVVAGGHADSGRSALASHPCVNCHVVPGVPGSRGVVGPPLTDWAGRAYIGGRLPNTPENLVRWIRNAPSVDPEVAMPDMGISDRDARNMAAYLYTLR